MKRIYLDYAASYGNPSSVHAEGRKAKAVLEDARSRIGKVLHCRAEELVFTGSGTEANNLAIFGVAPGHIISTNIEHHSVLRPLEKRGNTTFVPVKPNGIVDPQDIAKAIRPDTVLVSVIYANNEIGTLKPIKEISKTLHATRYTNRVLLHTDACQAGGFLNLNVQELGVDLMTINGAKVYGPKGIGALFIRRGIKIMPQILGGDQERGLRAGTQNPDLAIAFAKALELADAKKEKESARLVKLRDWLISQLPGKLNGDPLLRLPNNINISFDGVDPVEQLRDAPKAQGRSNAKLSYGVDGPLRRSSSEASEMLMLRLDLDGVAVSTGAACTVSSNEPSHVMQALSLPNSLLSIRGGAPAGEIGNLRITIGRDTTKKDLEEFVKILKKKLHKNRKTS